MNSAAWHKKRLKSERRFRFYGQLALAAAVAMLLVLLASIAARGIPGFVQTQIKLPVVFGAEHFEGEPQAARASEFNRLAQLAVASLFTDVAGRKDLRELYALVGSNAGGQLKRALVKNPELLGRDSEIWLPVSSPVDLYIKDGAHTPGGYRLSERQAEWISALQRQGRIRAAFNQSFFTGGDSRWPEKAGFFGAMAGSALTLIVCFAFVFPIGVATAVYLEEFARKSVLVDILEVNINNLAAVPSIVFGLLGLAVYINLMGMPRSAPLVGGLTLALMILPVIIISTRAALKSVPGSIRDAARALGATPLQMVWHHTLPLAMPGVMTGTILGMARAIGETAPLLMIGMVAFVADVPKGFTDAATAMPVQIYLWASSPEAGFAEKTAAGILVLLMLLLCMNALAIYLRKKFEVRF